MEMKKILLLMPVVVSHLCFAETQEGEEVKKEMSCLSASEIEKVSICIGNLLWRDLNNFSPYYDIDLVTSTLKKLTSHEKALMPEDECYTILEQVWEKILAEQCKENLALTKKYLHEIDQKPGVVAIQKNLLYYEILKPGNGEHVTEHSSPVLHFKESNLSGSVIRDTTKTAPIKITLAETIKGFALGVAGMRIGEKRKIYVHPNLAYGKIDDEPEQLLIFEVEILSID